MTAETNDTTPPGINVNPELVLTILRNRGETNPLLGEQVRAAILEAALATVTAASSTDDADGDDDGGDGEA